MLEFVILTSTFTTTSACWVEKPVHEKDVLLSIKGNQSTKPGDTGRLFWRAEAAQTVFLEESYHRVRIKEQLPDTGGFWLFWFQVILEVFDGGAQLWNQCKADGSDHSSFCENTANKSLGQNNKTCRVMNPSRYVDAQIMFPAADISYIF